MTHTVLISCKKKKSVNQLQYRKMLQNENINQRTRVILSNYRVKSRLTYEYHSWRLMSKLSKDSDNRFLKF